MLLSNPKFSEVVKNQALLSWEMVRAVPKVNIDFGNGKKLTRTLVGNTVLYVCSPDGTVTDAFPGVYRVDELMPTLASAISQAKNSWATRDKIAVQDQATYYARQQMALIVNREFNRINTSKMAIESPILAALNPESKAIYDNMLATTAGKSMVESPILAGTGIETEAPPEKPKADQNSIRKSFDAYAKSIEDVSKKPALASTIAVRFKIDPNATPEEKARQLIELDSRTNILQVRPGVLFYLSSLEKGVKPSELKRVFFRDLLHINIDDPYLGLHDVAMPGTPDN